MNKNLTFIGIDPGKQGAVAILNSEGKNLQVIGGHEYCKDEYDPISMAKALGQELYPDSFAVIERAQPMPKQGVCSMFVFGKGYGMWLAILALTKIPYQIVHSRVWTKQMLLGAPGEGKDRGYNAARRLFPEWEPRLQKEHQYADAILLAEYARRIKQGVISWE